MFLHLPSRATADSSLFLGSGASIVAPRSPDFLSTPRVRRFLEIWEGIRALSDDSRGLLAEGCAVAIGRRVGHSCNRWGDDGSATSAPGFVTGELSMLITQEGLRVGVIYFSGSAAANSLSRWATVSEVRRPTPFDLWRFAEENSLGELRESIALLQSRVKLTAA